VRKNSLEQNKRTLSDLFVGGEERFLQGLLGLKLTTQGLVKLSVEMPLSEVGALATAMT
jgi:hypothetical protein